MRTDLFGAFIIAAAAYLGVASRSITNDQSNAALIGLNLSYAIGVSIMLPFMVDTLAYAE